MLTLALQTLVGDTLIDREFCEELLNGERFTLLAEFDLANEEREAILAIEANSTQEFAVELRKWLTDTHLTLLPEEEMRQKHSPEERFNTEIFLVECLAWGLLRAYDFRVPPVPVQEMIEHPLPIFERLTLLKLNLGLYDAAYRPCLDGQRLIVVDPTKPHAVQRTSMARELYVAFCRSPRAAELCWPSREQPHVHSNLFARCLLMPATWVLSARAETISLESLAARFGIQVKTMTQRLSEIAHHHPGPNSGEPLTEALFSLKEPWRDRFLGFVAHQATNEVWNRQPPTRDEVKAWLGENPGLHQDIGYMLHVWQRPREKTNPSIKQDKPRLTLGLFYFAACLGLLQG